MQLISMQMYSKFITNKNKLINHNKIGKQEGLYFCSKLLLPVKYYGITWK